jgi:hypothetical protein
VCVEGGVCVATVKKLSDVKSSVIFSDLAECVMVSLQVTAVLINSVIKIVSVELTGLPGCPNMAWWMNP